MVRDQDAGAGAPVGPQRAVGVGEQRDSRAGGGGGPDGVRHRARPVALVEMGPAEERQDGAAVDVVGPHPPGVARGDGCQEVRQVARSRTSAGRRPRTRRRRRPSRSRGRRRRRPGRRPAASRRAAAASSARAYQSTWSLTALPSRPAQAAVWRADLALDPASIETMPRSRSGLTASPSPNRYGASSGTSSSSAGGRPSRPGVQDAGEAAGRRRGRWGVEEQVHDRSRRRRRRLDLDGQEQRRLALLDLLHQLGVPGVPLGQRRQPVAELQQQLQPVGRRHRRGSPRRSRPAPAGSGGLASRRPTRSHGLAPVGPPASIGTRTLLPHSVHEPS